MPYPGVQAALRGHCTSQLVTRLIVEGHAGHGLCRVVETVEWIGGGFAFNFDPLFALKNEPTVTARLPERPIDFGLLVDQAAVQISVEIGSVFDAIQQNCADSTDSGSSLHLNYQLAKIGTPEQTQECLRRVLQALDHVLLVLDLARGEPG